MTLLFCCLVPSLRAQDKGNTSTPDGGGGGVSRSGHRLSWSGDEYALRYEVVVEKEVEGVYKESLRKFTEAFFIETSLSPGDYRYSVIPYNLLNRPAERSEWVSFKVLSALNPELIDFSPVLIYLDKTVEPVLTVFGRNFTVDVNIYLRRPNNRETDLIFPVEMSISDNGNQARLHFHSSQFVPGTYDVHVRNPGGLEASMGTFTVIDHEPATPTPARKNNFFLRLQEAMNKLFRGK